MGLLSGSVSFTRFVVQGEAPPEHFWDFIGERVAANSFKDIDDTMDEFSVGWVSVASMFDADFAFSSYAAGDYVILAMRIDERKVSPAVLKKFSLKEEERLKRERQIPRLSRSACLEIRERVRAELVRKSVPIPAVHDLCWSLAENRVFFFSTNRKAIALVEELFRDTFDLGLALQIPWTMAGHALDESGQARLNELRPAILI